MTAQVQVQGNSATAGVGRTYNPVRAVVFDAAVPKYLTVKAVGEYLAVSPSTVYRLIDGGELTAIRVGKGLSVLKRSVEEFERAAEVAPGSLGYLEADAQAHARGAARRRERRAG